MTILWLRLPCLTNNFFALHQLHDIYSVLISLGEFLILMPVDFDEIQHLCLLHFDRIFEIIFALFRFNGDRAVLEDFLGLTILCSKRG